MMVFDMRVPIHETQEGAPAMDSLIKRLDEMLYQYGIKHCFALASHEDMAKDDKPLLYWLYYDMEQNTELTLVVALFVKLHLKKDETDDPSILAAIVKSMTRGKTSVGEEPEKKGWKRIIKGLRIQQGI